MNDDYDPFWLVVLIVMGAVMLIVAVVAFSGSPERSRCEQRGGVYAERDRICIRKEATLP